MNKIYFSVTSSTLCDICDDLGYHVIENSLVEMNCLVCNGEKVLRSTKVLEISDKDGLYRVKNGELEAWMSVCSAHQLSMSECATCTQGSWKNVQELLDSSEES